MIQKIAEDLPVLIGFVVVMLALYSCAFKRIWRERKNKAETGREKLLSEEETELKNRRL